MQDVHCPLYRVQAIIFLCLGPGCPGEFSALLTVKNVQLDVIKMFPVLRGESRISVWISLLSLVKTCHAPVAPYEHSATVISPLVTHLSQLNQFLECRITSQVLPNFDS